MSIVITVEVGRRRYGCERVGICSITIEAALSLKHVSAQASLADQVLTIQFPELPGHFLPVDAAITLSDDLARLLGAQGDIVTVLPGNYKLEKCCVGFMTRLNVHRIAGDF